MNSGKTLSVGDGQELLIATYFIQQWWLVPIRYIISVLFAWQHTHSSSEIKRFVLCVEFLKKIQDIFRCQINPFYFPPMLSELTHNLFLPFSLFFSFCRSNSFSIAFVYCFRNLIDFYLFSNIDDRMPSKKKRHFRHLLLFPFKLLENRRRLLPFVGYKFRGSHRRQINDVTQYSDESRIQF